MPRKRLGTMLIEAGAISEDALRHALVEQKRWGRSLGKTLVELKLVSEAELIHVLSQQLGVPVVEIDLIDVPFAVLELVPAAFAQEHDLVPFAKQLKFLDVAMADPADTQVIDQLQLKTKLNVRPHLAGPNAIERAMAKYYARGFAQHARKDI
jgi:type IV pilus assembly protein PilB